MTFTATDKLKEIEREIGWRLKVYPRRIADGKMSYETATRQTDIMREIANDYRQAASKERLL